jgi:hypothetical protein
MDKINHPECRLDKTSHAIFFTTCTNKVLQDKGEDIFQNWTQSTLQQFSLKVRPSEHSIRDIDIACLYSIDTLMKEPPISNQNTIFNQMDQSALTPREVPLRKRHKITENGNSSRDSTKGQISTATVSIIRTAISHKIALRGRTVQPFSVIMRKTNAYALRHTPPLHVISTSIPPDPIETWLDKQSLDDSPKGMTRVPSEKLKQRMPKSLVVFKDDKGRERILVPVCQCQRLRLVMREHETMLHQNGTRVHYKLSRKYIWPNMARDIKVICKVYQTCEKSKVRRQNLSAEFEQASKDDIHLPRQAYGIDFYVTQKAKYS